MSVFSLDTLVCVSSEIEKSRIWIQARLGFCQVNVIKLEWPKEVEGAC